MRLSGWVVAAGLLHHPDDVDDAAGDFPRRLQLLVECFQLRSRGQLFVEEQVRHFFERRPFSKVMDAVAAVEQLSLAPVDERGPCAVEVDPVEASVDLDCVVSSGHGGMLRSMPIVARAGYGVMPAGPDAGSA